MMNPPSFVCVKCRGAMEIGVIADHTDSGKMQSRWFEGTPKETFWSGLKTDGETQFKVVTYRCMSCGFLESYALDEER